MYIYKYMYLPLNCGSSLILSDVSNHFPKVAIDKDSPFLAGYR